MPPARVGSAGRAGVRAGLPVTTDSRRIRRCLRRRGARAAAPAPRTVCEADSAWTSQWVPAAQVRASVQEEPLQIPGMRLHGRPEFSGAEKNETGPLTLLEGAAIARRRERALLQPFSIRQFLPVHSIHHLPYFFTSILDLLSEFLLAGRFLAGRFLTGRFIAGR